MFLIHPEHIKSRAQKWPIFVNASHSCMEVTFPNKDLLAGATLSDQCFLSVFCILDVQQILLSRWENMNIRINTPSMFKMLLDRIDVLQLLWCIHVIIRTNYTFRKRENPVILLHVNINLLRTTLLPVISLIN